MMRDGLKAALALIRDGVLRVDTDGRIWREKARQNNGTMVAMEPHRAEYTNPNGYLYVVFWYHRKQYTVQAHQVVWAYFKGAIRAARFTRKALAPEEFLEAKGRR